MESSAKSRGDGRSETEAKAAGRSDEGVEHVRKGATGVEVDWSK